MQFQQCAIVILDHVELHSSYTAEPCAWLYFKGEKKASGQVHFEQQYCLDRSKAEFVSDILWPFYPSICNSSSIHSACPALLFTPGVPPPCKVSLVVPWDGGELKYEPPSPASSSAQQDARAGLLPAAECVSVGLWMPAVLEQPRLPQGRAHQCHSASDTSEKYCFIFCTVDCHSWSRYF